MTMPAYTRAVAEVLAEHQSRPTGSPFCRCGWRPSMFLNDTESDRLQHIGHQADMLAAANLLAYPAHAEWGVRYGDDSGASPAFVTTNQRRAEQDAAEWSHYTGQPTAIFRRQVTDWKEAER